MLLTMQEIRQTQEIYPSNIEITSIDKSVINSWFDTRYVCDNDNFIRYFQRVLVRDYGRYRELLRIEPNISKYDWLVQQYNESQTFTRTNDTTTANGENTVNSTQNVSGVSSHSGTDTTDETGTGTRNGNSTTTENRNDTKNIVDGGSDVSVATGQSNTRADTTASARGTDTVTNETHDNTKSLTRDNPMSISYGNGGASIDGNNNTGALSWEYPTSQAESDARGTSTNTTAYGRTDLTENTNVTDTQDRNTTTYGKTVAETGVTNGTSTDTHNENTTNAISRESTTATSDTNSSETTGTQKTITGNASNTQGQQLVQHINTGRSVDTATLLSQAQGFIMSSSAFQWLYSRLDVCFMSVYNDSADEYI